MLKMRHLRENLSQKRKDFTGRFRIKNRIQKPISRSWFGGLHELWCGVITTSIVGRQGWVVYVHTEAST